MARHLILCLTLFMSSLIHATDIKNQSKHIELRIELIPNYLHHMFTLGDIWKTPNIEYINKYKTFFPSLEIAQIKKNKDLLSWGNGISGEFTSAFFFVPMNQNITSKAELKQYLKNLELDYENGKLYSSDSIYSPFTPSIIREKLEKQKNVLLPKIAVIANAFIANIDTYEKCCWRNERKILEDRQKYFSTNHLKNNIISSWEKTLDLNFPTNKLNLYVTTANKFGPSANNISRDKYNFYLPEIEKHDKFAEFVSHEIGTNLLHEFLMKLYSDVELNALFAEKKTNNTIIWIAFEGLAEFLNGRVLEKKPEEWKGKTLDGTDIDFKFFFNFHEKNFDVAKRPIDYTTLIKNSIKSYFKEKK